MKLDGSPRRQDPTRPIVRVWRTRVDPQRVQDYQQFADAISLPMFRAHAGFLGVLYSRSIASGDHAVISFWEDMASVSALNASARYKATVRRIEETGFLVGESSVEVLEVEGGIIETGLAVVMRVETG